ncbi:major facilitator superfamily domain-containing protein [Circinella umbellata]|nr:major facilitator superfamily domain-containing protein [Circinella umbellata]
MSKNLFNVLESDRLSIIDEKPPREDSSEKTEIITIHSDSHIQNQRQHIQNNTKITTDGTSRSTDSEPTNEKRYNSNNNDKTVVGTHWSAWYVTACVMIVNAACAIMWTTMSSAPVSTMEWMQVDLTKLNWLSNVAAISNATFSLVAAYAYERFGIKTCLVGSAFINCIGCWIRCIAIMVAPEKRYFIILLGQVIASIGGPFVYNIAPKLVSVWFAPKDRIIANTLISLSIGMLISPLLMPRLANGASQVPFTLIVVAIISTACAIPIIFTPSKPKSSPSMSAVANRMTIWEGVKTLSKSFQFWTICILTAINGGMYFTMSVVVIEAATPFGYSEQQSGIAASLLMLGGFISGSMIGYWIGKTQQHLLIIKLLTPMVCGTYTMVIFEVVPNAYGVLLCLCFMIGFFAMGLFPVQLEYAMEISFPVPESVSSNIIWSIATVFLLIFTVLMDALRAGPDATPPNNMTMSMVAAAIIMCVGSIPCIWLKGDMKRMAVDQEAIVI